MVYNNNNTGINIQENTDNKQPKSSATDKFWENSPKHLRANCYIICVSFFFFVYILQRWSGVNLCMKFDWLLSERTKDHIRNDDDERQKNNNKIESPTRHFVMAEPIWLRCTWKKKQKIWYECGARTSLNERLIWCSLRCNPIRFVLFVGFVCLPCLLYTHRVSSSKSTRSLHAISHRFSAWHDIDKFWHSDDIRKKLNACNEYE